MESETKMIYSQTMMAEFVETAAEKMRRQAELLGLDVSELPERLNLDDKNQARLYLSKARKLFGDYAAAVEKMADKKDSE